MPSARPLLHAGFSRAALRLLCRPARAGRSRGCNV